MRKFVTIQTARGCAWRGIYVNVHGGQVFRIVLDPTREGGPRLNIAFGLGNFVNRAPRALRWACKHSRSFSLPLPHVRYGASGLRNWLAHRSYRFWHALDGRESIRRHQ